MQLCAYMHMGKTQYLNCNGFKSDCQVYFLLYGFGSSGIHVSDTYIMTRRGHPMRT